MAKRWLGKQQARAARARLVEEKEKLTGKITLGWLIQLADKNRFVWQSLSERERSSGIIPSTRVRKIAIGSGLTMEDVLLSLNSLRLKLREGTGVRLLGSRGPTFIKEEYVSSVPVLNNLIGREKALSVITNAGSKVFESSRNRPPASLDELRNFLGKMTPTEMFEYSQAISREIRAIEKAKT